MTFCKVLRPVYMQILLSQIHLLHYKYPIHCQPIPTSLLMVIGREEAGDLPRV